MSAETYRLVTRSDFDGLVCAVLLKELGLIESVAFAHPKDMQDGKVPVGPHDIITNLPYVETAHLVFDHHASEVERYAHAKGVWARRNPNYIIDPSAPSAARVVYQYYGGEDRFPTIPEEMMMAVDQADSGHYSRADILAPKGWTLLNFILDPRTGLERFRTFHLNTHQLMMELIDYCRTHTIKEILALPDVRERLDLYQEHLHPFIDQLERCADMEGDVVVLDLRHEETSFAGNRFMIYALFPAATVSIDLNPGLHEHMTEIAVGKSIVNRKSMAHIGSIMLEHGGGGHHAAGTCQVNSNKVMITLERIIREIHVAGAG